MLPKQGDDHEKGGNRLGDSADLVSTLQEKMAGADARSPLKQIGAYEIICEIGRGGMGIVYKARQLQLNRIVALKTIRGFVDAEMLSRFKREAEASARLAHENIVPVFDFFEEDDNFYLALGFIEGVDLESKLKTGPLNSREACRIVVQVANAIEYAHQQGVIHRDLKPSNVLIDKSGTCHVADFGLAKLVAGREDLTRDGQVLGTPAYMSPEQASGDKEKTSVGTDVYSLGAILYRCVTGRPPFSGKDLGDVLDKVCREDARLPSEINGSIDRDVDTICLKCLEKEPAARYRSASELAKELNRYLNGEPILSRPISAFSRFVRTCGRRRAETALAIATVFVICLGTALISNWVVRGEVDGNFHSAGIVGGTQVLVMLSAFGPVFSVCRAIGPSRLRKAEEVVLVGGSAVLKILFFNVVFLLQLLFLFSFVYLTLVLGHIDSGEIVFVLFSMYFCIILVMQWLMNWKRMFYWTICICISSCLGLALIVGSFVLLELTGQVEPQIVVKQVFQVLVAVLCVATFLPLWCLGLMTQVHFFAWLTHKSLQALQTGYTATIGFVPFPLSLYSEEYDMRTAYLVGNVLPVAFVLNLSLVLLFGIGTCLFVPFWLAEQLRRILTPEKPIFTDLLAYGVSILTLVFFAFRLFI